MEKKELAVSYKHSGCNCCQAVLMAYMEEAELSEPILKKLGAGFGGGMGGMEGDCGALIGAEMILGLLEYDGVPIARNAKALYADFARMAGAAVCGDLKGIKTGEVLCSCDDCVRYAVEALDRQLQK